MLDAHFGTDTQSLKNRASIVSGYLFFEDLIKTNQVDKLDKFVSFYLEFLDKLAKQARKGLDYDPEYRQLLIFSIIFIKLLWQSCRYKKDTKF